MIIKEFFETLGVLLPIYSHRVNTMDHRDVDLGRLSNIFDIFSSTYADAIVDTLHRVHKKILKIFLL